MATVINMVGGGGGGIKLASIEITTPPAKTTYTAGEAFDPAGMVVTATYSNGATAIATGYAFSPSTGLTDGTTEVTIQYTEAGVTKTATQAVTVTRTALTVPSQSGSLTYSGSAQSPTWTGYDSAKMTIGGATSGTNAGSYSTTFSLADTGMYCWSDGTTTAKTISWTIGKAAGSLSISPTSLTLDSSATSGTITVTRAGDGAISASSSNTGVATVSVSGNTITVNSVNSTSGSATITVSVAEGTNYTAPASVTCGVTAEFIVIGALNDTDWATIRELSDAGTAANYWAVGDRKAVSLSGTVGVLSLSDIYYCYIVGFDHNSSIEGANRIHFQFGFTALSGGTHIAFCDEVYRTAPNSACFCMNISNTKSGGWGSSYCRNTLCEQFKSAMPSDLKSVLKTVVKYSDNTGNNTDTASNVTATTETIFIASEYEIFGARKYANSAEQNYQEQYSYYSAGNSQKMYNHSSTGEAVYVWLRSVGTGMAYFSAISTSGSSTCMISSNDSYGFSPFFCV